MRLCWGREGGSVKFGARGPTTLLLGCASKSKLNLLLDQVPSVVFLRREQHEQLPRFWNAAVKHFLFLMFNNQNCIFDL